MIQVEVRKARHFCVGFTQPNQLRGKKIYSLISHRDK